MIKIETINSMIAELEGSAQMPSSASDQSLKREYRNAVNRMKRLHEIKAILSTMTEEQIKKNFEIVEKKLVKMNQAILAMYEMNMNHKWKENEEKEIKKRHGNADLSRQYRLLNDIINNNL